MVVESMAQTGVEATYCMGDDIPLAVLSDKPHPLYNYFKQRFAQVGTISLPKLIQIKTMRAALQAAVRAGVGGCTDACRPMRAWGGAQGRGAACVPHHPGLPPLLCVDWIGCNPSTPLAPLPSRPAARPNTPHAPLLRGARPAAPHSPRRSPTRPLTRCARAW